MGALLTEGTTMFDSSIVDFIFTSIERFLELFTANPALAIFLTLGIIGSVVGLVGRFVSMAKRGGH